MISRRLWKIKGENWREISETSNFKLSGAKLRLLEFSFRRMTGLPLCFPFIIVFVATCSIGPQFSQPNPYFAWEGLDHELIYIYIYIYR